jgi:hypothetical protein
VDFDPTPALGHDVLALFRGPFADVRFPDVDRDSLEEDARALLVRQARIESLAASLEDARRDLKDASEQLLGNATRALAYAKVFATGQPALEAALGQVRAVQEASASKERAPKKRRARRATAGEQLPIQSAPEPALAAPPTAPQGPSAEPVPGLPSAHEDDLAAE